jgi:hypothetical protein
MSDLDNLLKAYKKTRITEAAPIKAVATAATPSAKAMANKLETDIKQTTNRPAPERRGGRLSFDDIDSAIAGNWAAIEKPPGDLGDVNIGTWNGYKTLVIDLIRAYHSEPKENLLVYGDAGIGKSATVLHVAKQIASEEGREFASWGKSTPEQKMDIMANPGKYFVLWDIRVAGLEPSDIIGIPDISSAKEYLEIKQGPWIYSVSRPEAAGFLFFDEMNQGSPQVLKAFFEVVYDRSIGTTPMSDRVCVVGAGNLGTIYGNQDIPPALTDRFTAGFLVVDAQAWLHWAESIDMDPLILGFVKSNPDENFSFKPIPGQKSAKLPTPRSMAKLSAVLQNLYAAYRDAGEKGMNMPEPLMQVIARKSAHICGPDWGNEFMAYVNHVRTLTLKQILEHTNKGEFSAKSKQYIGAGKQHAIMQWFTDKLEKVTNDIDASNPNKPLSQEDVDILTAVAIISNDLAKQAPEWLATLWSTFKYVMPQSWIKIMEFLEHANYDPAVKQQFKTKTIPEIRLNVTSPENITYDSNGQPQLAKPATAPAPVATTPKKK